LLITAYLNNPPGIRCKSVEDVVMSLRKKHQFELHIIRSNEVSFLKRLFMPGFPAVSIDGRFVSKNSTISEQELESEILKRSA